MGFYKKPPKDRSLSLGGKLRYLNTKLTQTKLNRFTIQGFDQGFH